MRLQKVFKPLCEKAFNPLPTALISWKQGGEVKLVIQVKDKVICVPTFFCILCERAIISIRSKQMQTF